MTHGVAVTSHNITPASPATLLNIEHSTRGRREAISAIKYTTQMLVIMEIRDVSWVFPRILISFESYMISRSKSISDNHLGTQTLIMSWVIKVLRIEYVFYCTCADTKQYSAKYCKILKFSIRQDMGPECKLHAVKIRKLPPSSCIFSYRIVKEDV